MKNKITPILLLAVTALLTPLTTVAQWTQQASPTSTRLEGLFFLDANTGFTSSSYVTKMYKTTDGGATWASVGNYPARDIWFVDANHGFGSAAAGAANGTMKRTTNGGATWSEITPPNSSAYLGVFATSANNAYFINTEDKVIKTTNGGTSVTSYTIPLPNSNYNSLTDIFFADANTGYIVSDGGYIYKTTNAGTSWSAITSGISGVLNSVYFVNSSVGYAAGSVVIKTTDGGATWTNVSIGSSMTVMAIKFYDANNGLAVGLSGKIYRTTDGGSTWTAETSGTTSHLRNVFYLSATSAVVVGDDGTLLKNANLLAVNSPEKTDNFSFYPNPVTDFATLTVSNIDNYKNLGLEVYNTNGQLVKKDVVTTSQYTFYKNDLKAGVYFLNLKENNEVVKTLKFIIN